MRRRQQLQATREGAGAQRMAEGGAGAEASVEGGTAAACSCAANTPIFQVACCHLCDNPIDVAGAGNSAR